jgi:hypothetical protein
MHFQTIVIILLTLAGFALRLYYLTTTHPFFDEYTTVLAARQILQQGWPVLPSGLFYEHGLLATYLITPFTALFINTPISEWQPGHWGLMLARWSSLLISTATIPLIYMIGLNGLKVQTLKRSIIHGPRFTALLAAGLFALSPEGMVWGGRARMYALATLLGLLVVYWAYRGAVCPALARYRWGALLALLAALLTQFGAMLIIPPLAVAMVAVGWLSWLEVKRRGSEESGKSRAFSGPPSFFKASRPWFLRRSILVEGLTLFGVIGLAILIKRLGQPLGAAALDSLESGAVAGELVSTITYQTTLHLNWADAVDFLAQQFGVPHHFWLVALTLSGAIIWLIRFAIWTSTRGIDAPDRFFASSHRLFILFLWLVFGLMVLEMVTLLDPFRRNPRYLVMFLPLFYLIAAAAITFLLNLLLKLMPKIRQSFNLQSPPAVLQPLLWLTLFILLVSVGLADLRIALLTPEPAYEQAFTYIQAHRQPGDALLTMNTPAAALYQSNANGFTVQNQADQFLLNRTTPPVDRWLGQPWIGTAAAFNEAINAAPRTWFVIDTIRLPVYFRGDWQAILNSQMEQVWANDNALVYLTRPNRVPLPTQPDMLINAILGNQIQLSGVTFPTHLPSTIRHSPIPITLFWQALAPIPTDYTIFLHLRNANGQTVAQKDALSLDGIYPTGRWQPGETVIDPFSLPLPPDLPPGRYTLWAGLYRLDTLERLPVANDASGENAIKLAEIEIGSEP